MGGGGEFLSSRVSLGALWSSGGQALAEESMLTEDSNAETDCHASSPCALTDDSNAETDRQACCPSRAQLKNFAEPTVESSDLWPNQAQGPLPAWEIRAQQVRRTSRAVKSTDQSFNLKL